MGNTAGCQCGKYDDDGEIRTGAGIYKFKKTVNFILINYNISIFQKIKKNKFVYEKEKKYDKNIKGKIKPTSSIIKSGVKEYLNGNVNVIIPCPTDL